MNATLWDLELTNSTIVVLSSFGMICLLIVLLLAGWIVASWIRRKKRERAELEHIEENDEEDKDKDDKEDKEPIKRHWIFGILEKIAGLTKKQKDTEERALELEDVVDSSQRQQRHVAHYPSDVQAAILQNAEREDTQPLFVPQTMTRIMPQQQQTTSEKESSAPPPPLPQYQLSEPLHYAIDSGELKQGVLVYPTIRLPL